LPITLSTEFDESIPIDELASTLGSIMLPIQVKWLSLCLTYEQFMALSTLPKAALSCLSELDVELWFPDYDMDINMSDPHPLITQLRSVSFCGEAAGAWIDRVRPSLPWSQLRSLEFEIYIDDMQDLIIGILRQIPMLEALSLQIYGTGLWEQLTMPSLCNFTMLLGPEIFNVDNALPSFMCPSLTQFSLHICDQTLETFDILKQQYNIQGLREAAFLGAFTLPVSSFLQDAPMLHSLSLQGEAIIDEDALISISNGTLG
jgi:hypothetical protein